VLNSYLQNFSVKFFRPGGWHSCSRVLSRPCMNVNLWRFFRTRLVLIAPLRIPRLDVTERFISAFTRAYN
jgi:hypothetical protein